MGNNYVFMKQSYYHIRLEIIWEIVQKDLLPLREQIQTLYDNEI